MSVPPQRSILLRCTPHGSFEQDGEVTLKINGVRYIPRRRNGILPYYEAVDENNITPEQQEFFDYHYPCLEIDDRVYVVGMRSLLLDTGDKSTYTGCYLGTVRCYGEDRYVERGQVLSRETWERNVLGPIPAAFSGGLVIKNTIDMSQTQVRRNADVYGQYHGGGDVTALDSTHTFLNLGGAFGDNHIGVHCELMDDWYYKYTADHSGGGWHYDCFVNALTTKGAPFQMTWKP